jgi:hypothetical protein
MRDVTILGPEMAKINFPSLKLFPIARLKSKKGNAVFCPIKRIALWPDFLSLIFI